VIYMNSKPGNDPRRYLALREYERFTDVMDPPRAAKRIVLPRILTDMLDSVAEELGVGINGILSPSRRRKLVLARIVFCRRAYATGRYSTTQIGKVIQREHTTVCYFLGQLTGKRPPVWVDQEIRERNIKV
jgi:hypothetical protein